MRPRATRHSGEQDLGRSLGSAEAGQRPGDARGFEQDAALALLPCAREQEARSQVSGLPPVRIQPDARPMCQPQSVHEFGGYGAAPLCRRVAGRGRRRIAGRRATLAIRSGRQRAPGELRLLLSNHRRSPGFHVGARPVPKPGPPVGLRVGRQNERLRATGLTPGIRRERAGQSPCLCAGDGQRRAQGHHGYRERRQGGALALPLPPHGRWTPWPRQVALFDAAHMPIAQISRHRQHPARPCLCRPTAIPYAFLISHSPTLPFARGPPPPRRRPPPQPPRPATPPRGPRGWSS